MEVSGWRGFVGLGDQSIVVRSLVKSMVMPAVRTLPGGAKPGHPPLIVQDYAQKATVYRQRAAAGVVDKTKFSKLVHEMTDPRPCGANHLREVLLIDSGVDRLGPAFLAKMR